jgi:hypothetical protein
MIYLKSIDNLQLIQDSYWLADSTKSMKYNSNNMQINKIVFTIEDCIFLPTKVKKWSYICYRKDSTILSVLIALCVLHKIDLTVYFTEGVYYKFYFKGLDLNLRVIKVQL